MHITHPGHRPRARVGVFRRRALPVLASLALAPLLAGLATASPASASTTNLNFQLGWVTNTEFAGTYLAQSDGYFAADGLNVRVLPGGSDPVEPIVAEGKALVGDSNADTVAAAVAAGAKLVIIGAKYQNNPFCIISSAKDPIKNPQELIGKKVGVNTYNLTAWNVFLAINHISPSQVDTVDEGYSLGPTPLQDGLVQAWMGFSTNEPTVLTLAGFKNYSFLMAKFGYHVYADVYETTTAALKNDKPELIAFMKAEEKGWAEDIAHPNVGDALTDKLYEKKLGFSAAQQALENKAQRALMVTPYTNAHGLFSMSAADIAQNIATFKIAAKATNTTYDTSKSLFNTSIIDAVNS
jgi:ABC-type nitrate/sulfonate/bicarbonate transport system substrate-binding protein